MARHAGRCRSELASPDSTRCGGVSDARQRLDKGVEGMSKRWLLVAGLCFATVVCDGYDLAVYGATVPSLLDYKPWGMDAATAGAIGSGAVAGMLIGALLAGVVTDLIGRRRMLLFSVSLFSVCMGLCAIAPGPAVFGVCRALCGLGLGGVMPIAVALTIEFAPHTRRNFAVAVMNTGYGVGMILGAVVSIALVQSAGFRVIYAIGVIPLVVLAPVAWRWLPESPAYLAAKGRPEEAGAIARRFGIPVPEAPEAARRARLSALVRRPQLRPLVVFAIAGLLAQILAYGLNTWLPEIMRHAGYPLGSALAMLLTLSAGAVVGDLVLGRLADRFGGQRVLVLGFGIAVLSLLLLSVDPPAWLLYAGLVLAGIGTQGTISLLNSHSATRFDPSVRGSALGAMMGVAKIGGVVAPLIGGWIVGAGLTMAWSFYLFVLPAAVGVVVVMLDRARQQRVPAMALVSQPVEKN
ncbi:MFS transporter [Amycolatopsis thermophila]|uniref:AAHS family benzoate transporter-like MFS transporter n=1 Tax=Amycolatopsis thermophila TaxID=206084 RepID=A0ABU0F5H6_9PSEU|nr:aromatic acid/H+ symport family MFS transporter [Amycolatopsis thermophila]MDQ0382811.1 AAHS family benzoate transporter-like MFS transporter [Amycolatopsis thermophila]